VCLGACGSGDIRTTGQIMTTTPAVCIGRAEAQGVCVPGEDAEGHDVGECVTFTFVGDVGTATSIRDIETADAAEYPEDCPAP
jgi:hypothetical protein